MSRTTITLSVERYLQLVDWARVANDSGHAGSCPGGRRILCGYMCSICGRDPDDLRGCAYPEDHVISHLKNGGKLSNVPPYTGPPQRSANANAEVENEVREKLGYKRKGR